MGKVKRELGQDILVSINYRMVSVTGASQAGFKPIIDRERASFLPPRVQISADSPWENIRCWSVTQMKSDGGISRMRRQMAAILAEVLAKKSRRNPFNLVLNLRS